MKYIKNTVIMAGFAAICSIQASDPQAREKMFERMLHAQENRTKEICEQFENAFTPGRLSFYLGHDGLDGHIYGPGMCGEARTFAKRTQEKISERLKAADYATLKTDLNAINSQAESLCRTCAMLETKRRAGDKLGTLPAETTWYLLSPHTSVSAETFYKNGCGESYKDLSAGKLEQILTATKPASTKKFLWS